MKTEKYIIIDRVSGFVFNAEWRNGRKYPESFIFTAGVAKTLTYNQMICAMQICKNNEIKVDYIKLA